jgi:hypothetical protein
MHAWIPQGDKQVHHHMPAQHASTNSNTQVFKETVLTKSTHSCSTEFTQNDHHEEDFLKLWPHHLYWTSRYLQIYHNIQYLGKD